MKKYFYILLKTVIFLALVLVLQWKCPAGAMAADETPSAESSQPAPIVEMDDVKIDKSKVDKTKVDKGMEVFSIILMPFIMILTL